MPGPDKAVLVVGEWVGKAEGDLTAATQILKLGEACPTDTVCFHAQQCVEKHLKALLTLRGIPFPKTHNIRALMGRIPRTDRPPLSEDEQDKLTAYATGARYPGWGEIPLSEARRAVGVARRVRKELRRLLPRGALRRRGK